ncbi:DUF3987 domain-containing protein [Gemmobacter sp. LW-1]|uniref:DUF3987 domain-containing protein n=1 Tax=Gemmobacter sp. LW-1 TaxID=1529005 RepID=UPI0006C73EA2|nr:DUF3987 domain-containing protein [Gemmobacter sp. LW-1]
MQNVTDSGFGPQPGQLEPGDTDWLNHVPESDSWDNVHIHSLLAIAKQVEGVLKTVKATAPRKSFEQYAAEFKAGREALGGFYPYPDEEERIRKLMREDEARLTTPPPAFAPRPLDWPPGPAGDIARFIFAAAPRPVKEVAIIAALGLLAGLCGKAWQVPKSGLNLYIVLIARSAVGKEAMHSGISEIIAASMRKTPLAGSVADFTDYVSGAALIKACVGNPCFINVAGEIGRKFKRLAQDSKDSALQSWRTTITNLYHKSSATSTAGGLGYSNTENNVASIVGVAYSLIGETTPGTFLESLTSEMMEDGFMSRFTLIEYDGPRPEKNLAVANDPPDQVVQLVITLLDQANAMFQKGATRRVARSTFAAVTFETFELECDRNINASKDEARRQMWNRAALKALRIAALLAVAENPFAPVIRQAHADWAINLVMRDIATFTRRLNGGDVGSDDDARVIKLTTLIREYLASPVPASYNVPDAMRQGMIVPRNYLTIRAGRQAAFSGHRLGKVRALDEAIGAMVADGYLMEVQKDKTVEAYSYHGKAYRVIRLPDFGDQS